MSPIQPVDPMQLHAATLQAQKLESIGQLAAGIAHEMNTPIQYVGDNTRFLKDAFTSLLEVLRRWEPVVEAAQRGTPNQAEVAAAVETARRADLDYLGEEIPKALEQSLEGIDRVARIVRAMKEFSHPDHTQKVATDLNKCIETTITVARNEWKYVAEVVTDLDPRLPPVTCIPGDFNQVVLNLIVNAAHAIGDRIAADPRRKGTIRISTRADGSDVELRIGDSGTGIPEAIRSKIFDPFFTTKEVGKGTGQGLAIVYSVIVKKHAGTIAIETEENVGTTFVIRLPISCPDPNEEETCRAEAAVVC